MQEIDLNDNLIEEIKENTLSGFMNLQSLILSNNKIAAIQENAFNGLDY